MKQSSAGCRFHNIKLVTTTAYDECYRFIESATDLPGNTDTVLHPGLAIIQPDSLDVIPLSHEQVSLNDDTFGLDVIELPVD